MIVVSYIAVGVTPRTLGQQHADRVALGAATVLYPVVRVLGPVTRLLIGLGNALTPGKGFRGGPFASEAELRDLVDLLEQRRVIEPGEREMIHSVFEFGDTLVREVMVPRTDIVFIERAKTLRQTLSLALRSGFSRIPVVGENEDDVVGIAYIKDIVARSHEYREGESVEKVGSIMRSATYVPESKPIDELLREMQARQIHLAIVIDEYGGTAGLVTIEDILEELVGDIADEYDREQPAVEWLAPDKARVTARLGVDELAELFGVDHRGRRCRDGRRPARPRARPGSHRGFCGDSGGPAPHRGEPGGQAQPDMDGGGGTGARAPRGQVALRRSVA